MRKSIPFARSGLILPIIKFLNEIGTNIDLHLEKANIPLEVLENTERIVPLPMLINFIGKTAKAEGIENLGLATVKKAKITNTGTFGILMAECSNTYELLKSLCYLTRYTITPNGEKFWLIEQGEHIWLCQNFAKSIRKLSGIDSSYYYTLTLMIDCLRLTLGNDWQPPEIYLPTQPYQGVQELLNLSNTRFYYHQSYTAICIPKTFVILSINKAKKTINLSKNTNVDKWKNDFLNLDFINALKETIKILLLEKYPTINIVAEVCGLSVRSLQRYLSHHNLTYSQLIDKVRYDLALTLLYNQDVSLIEISYSLGFKDPANFSHSFRRWTGVTPLKFRKYLLEE